MQASSVLKALALAARLSTFVVRRVSVWSLGLGLLASSVQCPTVVGQNQSRRPISSVRPFTSIEDILNREAAASHPADIQEYSAHLIGLIVPDAAGKRYIESLSGRLAQAEGKARQGRARLIPEADVARVFNRLMRRIGAPTSFKTDEATVHRFRAHSIAVSSLPALISTERNGTYCNPGESVYLLYLMLSNNGDLPERILDDEVAFKQGNIQDSEGLGTAPRNAFGVSTGHVNENASWVLSTYSSRHRRQATAKLFDDIAHSLGF